MEEESDPLHSLSGEDMRVLIVGEVVQRRMAVAREAMKGAAPPAAPPGPTRSQLLQIVG